MALLPAGGDGDPNLVALANVAAKAGVELLELRIPSGESPAFCWNPAEGAPHLSGRELRPSGAFIRYDVFAGMKDPRPAVNSRALAWYQTLMGWLLSEPRIRIFNRDLSQIATNKPASLVHARGRAFYTCNTGYQRSREVRRWQFRFPGGQARVGRRLLSSSCQRPEQSGTSRRIGGHASHRSKAAGSARGKHLCDWPICLCLRGAPELTGLSRESGRGTCPVAGSPEGTVHAPETHVAIGNGLRRGRFQDTSRYRAIAVSGIELLTHVRAF